MKSPASEPIAQRDFALSVVQHLRDAGYEALWAGGCVRDALLNIVPDDYDVATSATPQEVIQLFGKRRTVPVGVSFGVVMVVGPRKSAGQVEVATFRSDGSYADGRRPDSVTFCSAEEDAKRRDFTINGMFFDPIDQQVIDYVGGREDLRSGIVRAIGNATARFTEDKLRMLRAIRFSATFDFPLEESTANAIKQLRQQICQVSIERISQELRRMLAHHSRAISVRNLQAVGLLNEILPQAALPTAEELATRICPLLQQLQHPRFESALSVLLTPLFQHQANSFKERTKLLLQECRRLRLSNEEANCVSWIADSVFQCTDIGRMPLHVRKTILADDRAPLLLDVLQAAAVSRGESPDTAEFLSSYLASTPRDVLAPAPLVDGADLKAAGVPPGPQFRKLLTQLRAEQLDETLPDRESALQRLQQLLSN